MEISVKKWRFWSLTFRTGLEVFLLYFIELFLASGQEICPSDSFLPPHALSNPVFTIILQFCAESTCLTFPAGSFSTIIKTDRNIEVFWSFVHKTVNAM